jgi:hypothetical protein
MHMRTHTGVYDVKQPWRESSPALPDIILWRAQLSNITSYIVSQPILRSDIECAVWNALSAYVNSLNFNDCAETRYKLVSYNTSYVNVDDLSFELDEFPSTEFYVPAMIIALRSHGNALEGSGVEQMLLVRIEVDFSLIGPQLSATVVEEVFIEEQPNPPPMEFPPSALDRVRAPAHNFLEIAAATEHGLRNSTTSF